MDINIVLVIVIALVVVGGAVLAFRRRLSSIRIKSFDVEAEAQESRRHGAEISDIDDKGADVSIFGKTDE